MKSEAVKLYGETGRPGWKNYLELHNVYVLGTTGGWGTETVLV